MSLQVSRDLKLVRLCVPCGGAGGSKQPRSCVRNLGLRKQMLRQSLATGLDDSAGVRNSYVFLQYDCTYEFVASLVA